MRENLFILIIANKVQFFRREDAFGIKGTVMSMSKTGIDRNRAIVIVLLILDYTYCVSGQFRDTAILFQVALSVIKSYEIVRKLTKCGESIR